MKLFKLTIIVSAFVLVCAVAWAGNCPEYDAYGRDIDNFYAQYTVYYQIVNYKKFDLEWYSDFTNTYVYHDFPLERFETNAGQLGKVKYYDPYEGYYRLVDNPCYPGFDEIDSGMNFDNGFYGPPVAVTDVWNQGRYEWWIVLQMKPESDINLNIYDCVLKHNETNLWYYAEQTGRYRMSWGELKFEGNGVGSPIVYASALPGEYATDAFAEWHHESGEELILDARTLPGLARVPLDGVAYTSKAHWPEGIVMALPVTGETNNSGQDEYNLKAGDVIHVKIEIGVEGAGMNSADIWYGPESVILKYIGIVNSEYWEDGPTTF